MRSQKFTKRAKALVLPNYSNVNHTNLNLPGPILNGTSDSGNSTQVSWQSTGNEGNSTSNSSAPVNSSKGVRSIAWISVPGYKVEFYTPDDKVVFEGLGKWEEKHQEVESYFFDYTRDYGFKVTDDRGSPILQKKERINTLSENIGGDITSIRDLGSLAGPEVAVSFGFSDTVRAAESAAGVPNTDACWVTVTRNQKQWMGRLAPPKSAQAAKPFNTLVLPAPHDPGMNTMDTITDLIEENPSKILGIALDAVFGPGMASDIAAKIAKVAVDSKPEKAENVIAGLAITQKDSTPTMLAIGARYFEYRPAYISEYFQKLLVILPVPNKLYFHHWIFPGQAFDDFLAIIVKYLADNPTEIVVVHIRGDGIQDSCKKASSVEVDQLVDSALKQFGGSSVARGNSSDMSRSIDELRQQKKRLILLQEAKQYTNYDEGAMKTLDGRSILETLPKFLKEAPSQPKEAILAVWQIQATTQFTRAAFWTSVFAQGLTSTLLLTKPIVDALTLPWLQEHVYPNMTSTRLQVIMNDFFDGATADVAIRLSEQYLSQKTPKLNGPKYVLPVGVS